MYLLQLTLAAVLAILGVSDSAVPPAGKCNASHITTIPVDFNGIKKNGKWEVLYVPDAEPFLDMDSEFRDAVFTGKNMVKASDIKVGKNKSKLTYEFTLSYIDGVIVEDIIDEYGKRHQFRNYPLSLSEEFGFLYYRCSDNGTLDIDTRYIIILRKNKLSEEGTKQLMDADKKFNFRGGMRRLPLKLRPKESE